jgi:hypothetical protein
MGERKCMYISVYLAEMIRGGALKNSQQTLPGASLTTKICK